MSEDPHQPRDLRLHDFAGSNAGDPDARLEEDLLPNRPFPSNLFWRMTKWMDPGLPPGRILDLGPTSNANIQFWGERGFDVTCFDLFAREARWLGSEEPSPMILTGNTLRDRRLPYEGESFSAVCAWNVLSRMPFVLAQQFSRECHRVLCPSGLLHAIFLDADGRLDGRRQYRIVDRQRLQVSSVAVSRRLPGNWVDAEIKLLLSRFAACEIQPAPAYTREVLGQRDPIRPMSY